LAQYIHFASKVLCFDSSNVRIYMDDKVGTNCKLLQPVKQAIDHMVAACSSSTGLVGSKTFTLNSYKGPAQAYLVAIRTLNMNISLFKPLEKKKASNLNKLKDTLDTLMGLKTQGVTDFAKSFIRQVFSLATTRELALPSPFYLAAKSENKVSSKEGILACLGYIPIVPSVNKIIKIATTKVECNKNGVATKATLVGKDVELNRDNTHVAAFKMLLPLISEDGKTALSEQTKHSEKYLSEESRKFYSKNASFVVEVNKTYAITSAGLNAQKKKTNPKHVQNAIGKLSRELASELIFQDRSGKIYSDYMEVPASQRHHLEKLLKRKLSRAKRSAEDESSEDQKKDNPDTSEVSSSQRPARKKSKTGLPEEKEEEMAEAAASAAPPDPNPSDHEKGQDMDIGS